jgi:hypothetical protein
MSQTTPNKPDSLLATVYGFMLSCMMERHMSNDEIERVLDKDDAMKAAEEIVQYVINPLTRKIQMYEEVADCYDWTTPNKKGIVQVPKALEPLVKKLATQLRLHTTSGKQEGQTVVDMVFESQLFFHQLFTTLYENNRTIEKIADLEAQVSALKLKSEKADKWDKLAEQIGKFYEDDDETEGDLADIGELAASSFGYL